MPIIGNASSGGKKPGTPTSVSASAGNASATVSFTEPSYEGKTGSATYVATSNPGSVTGSSTTSPITVSSLSNGTAYTFTVVANTPYGVSSDASSASNSVTPVLTCTPSCGSWSYTYGSWSGWSTCSGGTQSRTRTVSGTRTCTASDCSTYTETSSSTESESQSCAPTWYCSSTTYEGGSYSYSQYTTSSDQTICSVTFSISCSTSGYPGYPALCP